MTTDGLRALLAAADRKNYSGEYADPADPSIVYSNHDPEQVGDDEMLEENDTVVHVSFVPTEAPQEFADIAVVLPFRRPQQ